MERVSICSLVLSAAPFIGTRSIWRNVQAKGSAVDAVENAHMMIALLFFRTGRKGVISSGVQSADK